SAGTKRGRSTAPAPPSAIDQPKASPEAPCADENFWDSIQESPALSKAYTAPCAPLAPNVGLVAPISAVVPRSATDQPNWLNSVPSLATSFCVWVQVPFA